MRIVINHLKKIGLLLMLLVSSDVESQSLSGYWDNQRATTKELIVKAGKTIVVPTENFPIGTTEFAYRITLLDENQKLVSDLASVLKTIPDPYYIAKGTGGAISLLSSISGSDKCTYAVFINEKIANDYSVTQKNETACLYQNKPVSKDAKVISMKSACLQEDTNQLWFVFKNQNWLMGEKIVLEVVPWIDIKASQGWTAKNKQHIINLLKKNPITNTLSPEQQAKFAFKLIDRIALTHRFQDYKALSEVEQQLLIDTNIENALQDIGLPAYYNDNVIIQAKKMANLGHIDAAIELIQTKVIAKTNATALQHNALGELYMQSNQLQKALQTFQTAENLDSSNLKIQMNLAHVYMFLDEVGKAKEIHKKYANQNISANQTWKNKAINDLARFDKNEQLPKKNIHKIARLFN